MIDRYDPEHDDAPELLGYREHEEPGIAGREMWFEDEEHAGPRLRLWLFGPDRLRECVEATDWQVTAIQRGSDTPHYLAALEKR